MGNGWYVRQFVAILIKRQLMKTTVNQCNAYTVEPR